ncbi:uracil-DNA glycosylase 2 [Ixodes scapularis]
MPGQKQILSFFKPVGASKRLLSTEDAEKAPKRARKGEGSEEPASADEIERKRLLAKLKLRCRATPVLTESFGLGWFAALEAEFSKDYFHELSRFVMEERQRHTVYPAHEDVFAWTRCCDIDKVAVVILGQDPYHNPGQAHGLAFSVPKGVAVPHSLINMYRELEEDVPGFQKPPHGNLTGWAEQGVLLLNACLTVRAHAANSHKDRGWEKLTDVVVGCLNKRRSNLAFLLWGAYAQKKGAIIDRKRHLVLQCAHPSPLSASRGFFGCRHFSKANDYLAQHNRPPINWGQLP